MLRISIVVFGIFISSIKCANFPSNIQKCKLGDLKCYTKTANFIIEKAANGYPELGLPPLDPLVINKIGINQKGERPVQMNFEFRNCKMYGLSTIRFKSIDGFKEDSGKFKINLKYTQEKAQIIGDYFATGKILIIPMNGNGFANVTYNNLDCQIRILGKKSVRNGRNFLHIDKVSIDFDAERAHHHFTNLFKGNKELSDQFNIFVEENYREILQDTKPAMTESLGAVYKSILNNMFDNIPFDEFFEK